MGGRKTKPLVRWSILDAEREFPISRGALAIRLSQLGIAPGRDKKFSTRDICAAVYTDREIESARLIRAQADRAESENAERARKLIPVADALQIARKWIFEARNVIVASGLPVDVQNQVIGNLRELGKADLSKIPDEEI